MADRGKQDFCLQALSESQSPSRGGRREIGSGRVNGYGSVTLHVATSVTDRFLVIRVLFVQRILLC